MEKIIKILSGVLVLQIVLVAFFGFRGDELASFKPNEKLLNLSIGGINKILVQKDGGKDGLTLVKEGAEWRIAELENFPAKLSDVESVIKKLAELKKSWAVGNSDIAARQLKTHEKSYERKVSVFEGDKSSVIYIGSTPSFKKVHARVDGDSNTYSVDFSIYDFKYTNNDWLDKNFYAVGKEKVKRFSVNDVALKLDNSDPKNIKYVFDAADLPAGQNLNQAKVTEYLGKLGTLAIKEVVTGDEKAKVADKKSVLEVKIDRTDNTQVIYGFYEGKDANDILLKSSSQPYVVRVDKAVFEAFKKMTKEELFKAPEVKDESRPENSSAAGSPNMSTPSSMSGEQVPGEPMVVPLESVDGEEGGAEADLGSVDEEAEIVEGEDGEVTDVEEPTEEDVEAEVVEEEAAGN